MRPKRILVLLLIGGVLLCASSVSARKYNEAPMLAELVEQGKLPPVNARLPEEPVVIEPLEKVGVYGGTWRNWNVVAGATWYVHSQFKYERMVRQKADLSFELEPDLADWWKVSDDSKTYTLHIREGLRWSDGHLFTTEDIDFYWNDIMNNEELRPPLGLRKYPGTLEVVDENTFKLHFEEPDGVFLLLNSLDLFPRIQWHYFPKHYLEQFHSKYTSAADLQAKMKEAGVELWPLLFNQKAAYMKNPELPQVSMFVAERGPDETGYQVYVRNPYYYKVDTAGNQLPYIDRMEVREIRNLETALMEAIAGNIDYHIVAFRANHYPTLKQNEAKNPYSVDANPNAKGGEFSLFLNQTTTDPQLRKLFQDIRFRKAVSHAINRQEIVDTVFWGAAQARQCSPVKGDPLYSPEGETLYTEYNPDKANGFLDEIGLIKRDKDGYRLGLDGKSMSIIFDWSIIRGWNDAYQLITEYLEAIGLRVISRGLETGLYIDRGNSNEYQMHTSSMMPGIHSREYLLPSHFPSWGHLWNQWINTDGKEGKKPTADVLKIKELYDKAEAAASPEEMLKLLREAGEIWQKNLYVIGVMGNDVRPQVVHDRMKNIRRGSDTGIGMYINPAAATHHPEQFYIDPNVPK